MLSLYLEPSPVSVILGNVTYTIPGVRADRWLLALTASGDDITTAVLPGMLPTEQQSDLMLRMMRGHIDPEDIADAAWAAIKMASGLEWWEAIRLTGAVDQPRGELYGRLLLAGVDPRRLTLAAWCAAVFAHLMTGLDEKERSKVMQSLIMPPAGIPLEDVQGWDTGRPDGF